VAKPTIAALGFGKVSDGLPDDSLVTGHYELGDAFPSLDGERLGPQVNHDYAYLPPIVGIHGPGAVE
jgi:hypothetical protein